MPIKVIIVDDSKLIREMLEQILCSDPEIHVVATAVDVQDAREKIKQFNPDVITLDIEMPGMDGISFLEKIMSLRPMPVVMISTLTQKGADSTIRALELGAVDYVSKPTTGSDGEKLKGLKEEIITKVKNAAKARVRTLKRKKSGDDKSDVINVPDGKASKVRMVAIGSSTGGVEALKEVLTKLPMNMPPVVIVQHMPPKFTKSFAERMNGICQVRVHEATDGEKIMPGHVYVAPGAYHLRVIKQGAGYICQVGQGENVSGHCPSVDVMFDSVARNVTGDVVGVILTGMGRDGAEGMYNMKKAGAFNIGQDEQSCVVYGMPKEAFLKGAVHIQKPLDLIAAEIVKKCYG